MNELTERKAPKNSGMIHIHTLVRKYLECGDLGEGFARIKCLDCHHEYNLAFSCRGRWFCPSCHNKKAVQFGHHLKETVLYPVPHRQYVFSVPKILRRFFFYDRKLVGKLSQCAVKSLTKFFQLTLGKKTGIPAVVVAIQTFTAKSTLLEITPDGIPTFTRWLLTDSSWKVAISLSCRKWIFIR